MPKRIPRPSLIAFSPNKTDLELLDRLQKRLGIRNRSDIIRLAIRRLADAEGVGVEQQMAPTGTDG